MLQSFNEQFTVNIFLTFESISTFIYNWKFTTKEHFSNLINQLTEYKILLTPKLLNNEKEQEIRFYDKARKCCLEKILQNINKIDECMEKMVQWIGNLQKIKLQVQGQKDLLQKRISQQKPQINTEKTEKQRNYQFLFLQLLQLSNLLIQQYGSQHSLLQQSLNQIVSEIFIQHDPFLHQLISTQTVTRVVSELEILLMHVQYQTEVTAQYRDQYMELLAKVNNTRGALMK